MIQHFWQNIHGWDDGIPPVYQEMVKQAEDGSHFVEVGSWKGKSSAYMAVEIANSGKRIRFDCVDTWGGSAEHQQGGSHADTFVVDGTLFNHFVDNMKPVEGYYNAVKNYSIEAAKLYENESLDFVFIDAAHDYENVKADIIAWLPKVKQGGWIGGHDYTWSEGVRQACRELVPGHVPDPSWDLAQNKPNPKYENCSSWMYQIPI